MIEPCQKPLPERGWPTIRIWRVRRLTLARPLGNYMHGHVEGLRGKVRPNGQIDGICVGTGMAFDPAFYALRPTSVEAAHGCGPALLAGAEIIAMNRRFKFGLNDSALMYQGARD